MYCVILSFCHFFILTFYEKNIVLNLTIRMYRTSTS